MTSIDYLPTEVQITTTKYKCYLTLFVLGAVVKKEKKIYLRKSYLRNNLLEYE